MDSGVVNQQAETENGYFTESKPLKHSGLGIASFVISLINGFFVVGIIFLSVIMEVAGVDEDSVAVALLGLGAIFVIVINLVGLGLGIGGCFIKGRKILLAVLGIIFNAVPMLILVLLILIGLAVG